MRSKIGRKSRKVADSPAGREKIRLPMMVLRYHTALITCVGDPQKMVSYCTAEGESLDKLYWDMVKEAHRLAGLPEPKSTAEQEKK